jgi:drug/metabolite transporter (DMT)-like permease
MLLATFCWSANLVAGKKALMGFGPLALAQLRIAGAAILFSILVLLRGNYAALRLRRRQWLFMALTGLVGVTLNQLCFIGGLAHTSVAHAGLVVALGPVLVLVLSCLLRLESLTIPKFVGMLIAFGGVVVLTTGKAGRTGGGHWIGDLIILAGTGVFAYYTILMKQAADEYDVWTLNALTFGLGFLFMIPFGGRAALEVRWSSLPAEAWLGLGFMVAFGSVIAYLIYAFALTELTASRVAAFGYLQPVIATALGIWLLAEKLTPGLVVGGTLILAGVYLTERERVEEKTSSPESSPGGVGSPAES